MHDASTSRRRPTAPTWGDVVAGVSVALVAFPQSLAYAELAGMPPVAGLLAIVPALLASAWFLAAHEVQVGPVATTSLLTFGVLAQVARPGSDDWIAAAALLAVMVGVVRIAIGLVGAGGIAYLLARPVRIGFLAAAAVLIAASQLPTAVGVAADGRSVMGAAWHAVSHPGAWHLPALAHAAATVVGVHLLRRVGPTVPGVLVAVVASTVVATQVGYTGAVVGEIPSAWPRLHLDLPWTVAPTLLVGAVVVALVGFAEAASIERDLAARSRRSWNPGRAFVAHGISNVAAGVAGGMPVGASFSRSAVSRMTGARTRWTPVVTAVTLLAAVPLAPLLAGMPRATLAGIVLAALVGMVRREEIVTLLRTSRAQSAVAVATFALTLGLAPRIDEAILIGVLLAAAQHLRRELDLRIEAHADGDVLVVAATGVLWYGSVARLEDRMPGLVAQHPGARALHLDVAGCGRIDWSAAMALREIADDAAAAGLQVHFVAVPAHARRWFSTVWRTFRPPGEGDPGIPPSRAMLDR